MSIWLKLRNLVLKETTNMSLCKTHKLLYGIHILCLLIVVTLTLFMVLSYQSFFSFSKPCRWARENSLWLAPLAWEYYKSERLRDFIMLPQILRPTPHFRDPTVASSFYHRSIPLFTCEVRGALVRERPLPPLAPKYRVRVKKKTKGKKQEEKAGPI